MVKTGNTMFYFTTIEELPRKLTLFYARERRRENSKADRWEVIAI